MKAALLGVLAVCALAGQSLRSLADARGIRIGTAVAPAHLSETEYAAVLAREFNQVEPENAMKFESVHPGAERYNFGPADTIVAFAQAHGMAVRGHTLVWHNQVPRWVKEGNFSAGQLSAISREHIRTVVGHYAGKVYAWDVVNEAFESDGSPRKTIWSGTPDYIEQALKWAHEADPKALLFYNDFEAEAMNAKSDAIFRMAQDFKSRGVPLDGIGFQMHIGAKPLPAAAIGKNMERLTALGLQVQITELDVALRLDSPDFDTQAKVFHDVMALCLQNARCTAVQTWGFTDRYSWIPAFRKGFGAALEFDAEYRPKPAYQAMVDALK